jgi:hypothetical protein
MPSRIVREGINSSRAVSSLSEEAQLFYRTLMLIVDDYGRFEVDLDVIRATCFPRQLDRWPPPRIESCLNATVETLTDDGTPLIQRYRVASKEYLQFTNFGQRVQSKAKFPGPPGSDGNRTPTVGHGSPTVGNGEPPSRALRARTKPESNAKENPSSPGDAADFALQPDAPPPAKGAHNQQLVTTGWFDEFWGLYWRKDGKERAKQIFSDKVKTTDDWARCRSAVIAQTAEMLAREKQHRPHASTWLNQGRMFDEESPPQISARRQDNVHDRNQQRRDEANQIAKLLRRKTS